MFSRLAKKIFSLYFVISILAVLILFSAALYSLRQQSSRINHENITLAIENVRSKVSRTKKEIIEILREVENDKELVDGLFHGDVNLLNQRTKLYQLSAQAAYVELISLATAGQVYRAKDPSISNDFDLSRLNITSQTSSANTQIADGGSSCYLVATIPIRQNDITHALLYLVFPFQSDLTNYLRSIGTGNFIFTKQIRNSRPIPIFSNLSFDTLRDFMGALVKDRIDLNNQKEFHLETPEAAYNGLAGTIEETGLTKFHLIFLNSSRTEFEYFKPLILSFIALIIFALGAAFIISQLNIYQVVVPLLDITEAIRELSSGESYSDRKVSTHDEMGQLYMIIQKINNTIRKTRNEVIANQKREQAQEERLDQALERSTKKYSQVSLLLEIAQSTNFLTDGSSVIALIAERLALAFEFHRVSIMLADEKSNYLELLIVKGYNMDTKVVDDIPIQRQVRLQIGEGIAGLALEKGKLIVADQGFQEKTFKKYGSMIDSTVRYLVCAPLIVNDRKLGVINLSHGENVTPLQEDDIEFLNICAKQIAVTIENARIFDAAITDSMTDLFNYRYFQSRMLNEMRRVSRRKTSLGLLYLAIDNFDSLISLHGKNKVDILIADLGLRLKSTLRGTDIIARVKDNEFVALLPETESNGARVAANKLIHDIANTRFGDKETVMSVTISIGIAIYPNDSQGTSDLIRLAEYALQKAQEKGPSSIMGFANRNKTSTT